MTVKKRNAGNLGTLAAWKTSLFCLVIAGLSAFSIDAAEPQNTALDIPENTAPDIPENTAPDILEKASQDNPAKAKIGIVFRFSINLFDDLTRDEIEMTIPIDQRVEEMSLKGEASGNGVTKIVMHDSDEVAAFVLGVSGRAVGSMNADAGPANIHLTSRSQFSIEKQISFDGDTFHQSQTDVDAKNRSSIDRICAKRGGLVGHLVEHIVRKIACKSIGEINNEAEEMTESILTDKFDEATDELVKELNLFTPFREIADQLFPETKDWTMRTATKSNHLLAGFGPQGAEFPEQFLGPPEEPTALAELWLQITPAQAILLQIVTEMDAGYDMLREVMPDDHAKAIADDARIIRRGDWTVIQIGVEGLPESPE